MIYKFNEPGVNETTLELEVQNGDGWDFGDRNILIVTLIVPHEENHYHLMCKSEVLALRKSLDLIIEELND